LVEYGFIDERDQPDPREHPGGGVSPHGHGPILSTARG
jgi:hypothetical protein